MSIPSDSIIIDLLRTGTHVTGSGPSGGFAYDLDLSMPIVATAIHAGHHVREELLPLMAISEAERLFEEDPATDRIIGKCPSAVWGLDSRSEYDLNRPPELALPLTPEMFWGTRVFRTPPSDEMNRHSLEKYEDFYRFFAGLVQVLLERFGCCVVYDIHSYNITRQVALGHASPPLFNLGTAWIDRDRWRDALDHWLEELAQITVPGQSTTVSENRVFQGKGAFGRRLQEWSKDILVLPTEISKIYMDERIGRIETRAVEALQAGMAKAVLSHGKRFIRRYGRDGV